MIVQFYDCTMIFYKSTFQNANLSTSIYLQCYLINDSRLSTTLSYIQRYLNYNYIFSTTLFDLQLNIFY